MKLRQHNLMLLLALLPVLGSCDVAPSGLDTKKITRSVAYRLPLLHLNQLPLDENIATNAFDLYIESLDPSRSYFLQSDIDAFSARAGELSDLLRKGDISFALNVYDVLMERMKNRLAFTEKLLEQGFDTSVDETFLWDRKNAAWAEDEAEWDELWRKRIKNEYIARLVSQQVFVEADAVDPHTATNSLHGTSASNAVASAGSADTNSVTATAGGNPDEAAEFADLSPEEFILERYRQFQLNMESFDEEIILQRYLSSFSHVYDPHSDYMSPSSVEDFDINMKLSLVGIGAMLRSDDGMAKIVRIIPGGPAERDGRLKTGDKIIAVAEGDGEPVSILHWPLYKAVRLIRGEINSKVVLTVIPVSDRSDSRTVRIELIRDEVKLEEQAAKSTIREIDPGDGRIRKLGVITLPDFYVDFAAAEKNEADARRSSTDMRRLIDELILQGIEGLVIDLRNNGGGALAESIDIAGLFITSGPVVQVKENRGVQVLPDVDPSVSYEGPLVVLVNRLSASASEILAAALQDYGRAVIVGDRQTHGKGTVQTLYPLGGERRGRLKLTTAGFYRINGDSTQLKGVTPDIIIPSYLDVMDIGEDSLEHALPWDTVRRAMYRTSDGLGPLIPELAERSRKRIKQSEDFQFMLQRRERLRERFETPTVSLSLEDRIAEAQEEKELDDIQTEAFMSDESGDESGRDIVLEESLHILTDLIELGQSAGKTDEQPALITSK